MAAADMMPPVCRHDARFCEEWRKMLSGEVYDAGYQPFIDLLVDVRRRLWEYNTICPDRTDRLREILKGLLGASGNNITVNPPFRCDYGCNIRVGENFFANFNLTIVDEAFVTIGDNVFIGPNVSIFTACHPLDPAERDKLAEWAEPVTIGDSVWIGGDVTILPGVTIGSGTTIGAGSVVARDIPAGVLAVGNPCRVIRKIAE